MGYGVRYFPAGHLQLTEAFFISYIALRILSYLGHGADGLHRILSCRSFSGKHYGSGAVIYGVCHVSDLCPCRTRIMYHGIKHLGSRYDYLSGGCDLFDDAFLYRRYLPYRYLYSKISSCHHYSVRSCNDLIYVLDALAVFYLGYDSDILSMMLL